MVIVEKPRCAGPARSAVAGVTNSNSSDRPVMTSGMTIGEVIMPENRVLPLKRPKRASTSPGHRAEDRRKRR